MTIPEKWLGYESTKTVKIEVSTELHLKIQQLAVKHQLTTGDMCRELVELPPRQKITNKIQFTVTKKEHRKLLRIYKEIDEIANVFIRVIRKNYES